MKHAVAEVARPSESNTVVASPTVRSVTIPASALDFEAMYLQYRERMYSYLVRFVGRDAAEDLTQEVFLRLYQAFPRLSGEVSLKGLLHRIATNTAYDVLRRRRLVNWVALDALGERPGNTVQDDPQARYNDASEVISQALAQMTPKYRQALLLQLQGYSCAEIGAIIGASRDAIKMRLYRARQQFRQLYQQLLEQEMAA